MSLIGFRKVVILLILVLVLRIHKAMRLVHHVLLAAARIAEHLSTEEAELAKLNTLGDVGQQAFQGGHTIDIQDVEGVFETHMVEALLHT